MHSSFLLVCSKIRRLVQTNDQQTGAEASFPLELLSQGGDWHPASAVTETLRQSPAQVLMFPSFSRVTLMLQLYRPFCLSPPHTLLLIIDKANHILLYSHFIPSILLYSLSFIFFFFFSVHSMTTSSMNMAISTWTFSLLRRSRKWGRESERDSQSPPHRDQNLRRNNHLNLNTQTHLNLCLRYNKN